MVDFVKIFKRGNSRKKNRCLTCNRLMPLSAITLDCDLCWEGVERGLNE